MRQTRSRTKAESLPSDISDLQKSIDSFSTAELHELLDIRPYNKISKSNLRDQSYDFLRRQYTSAKPKIASILAKRQTLSINPVAASQALQFQAAVASNLFNAYQQFNVLPQQQQQQQQQQAPQPILQANTNGNLMYQPTNLGIVTPSVSGNGNVAHTNGLIPGYAANIANSLPIHPDVKLKKLAFFDVIATLLKPSTLLPTANSQRQQEGTYYFHLTPQQATDIASNRDIRNASKVEHIIQVQLRFCMLETSCEQDDYFPPNVVVKVNNKMCPLPNPIPTNKPGVEPKRPPRPVNITTNVKLSPTVANNISVTWCTDFNRGFVISAYLVKKLTSAQLLQRMKTKGIKPADYTRALIKEKLNEDADCEIATTMLRVSLMCPLGKMRMSTPCRASTCSHLQCFDASLFLQMNERKPTWNCPVCDKPAVYDTLVIDGYFQEVLSASRLPSEINEIQLLKDGSWSTHEPQAEAQSVDTPSKNVQKVELEDDVVIISDDSPKSSIKNHVENNGNGAQMTLKSNEPSSTTTVSDSVDLTLSDSDDDTPIPRKAPASTTNALTNKIVMPPVINNANVDTTIISLDSPSPPSSPVNLRRNPLNNDGSHLNPLALTSPSATSVINTAGTVDTNNDLNTNYNMPDLGADLNAERFDPLTEYHKWINDQMVRSFANNETFNQNRF